MILEIAAGVILAAIALMFLEPVLLIVFVAVFVLIALVLLVGAALRNVE